MLRFRATLLALSFMLWSALAFLAASHKIKGVVDIFGASKPIPVVVSVREPPPPPPPPPETKQVAEPKFITPLELQHATWTPIPVSPPYLAPSAPSKLVGAIWLKRPGAREFDRYYPARASERDKEGRVELNCNVNGDGTINCTVADEAPVDWGFGDAAVQISKSFRMAPQTISGAPTSGGVIRVPIIFKLGG